jgi:hypothetical protein
LGRFIAELLRSPDTSTTRALCSQALGRALADHLLEVACGFKLEHAARKRRARDQAQRAAALRWKGREVKMRDTHDRELVQPRKIPHAERSEIVRRYVALICMIFDHVDVYGDNVGRAAGADMFLGHSRTKRDGEWSYCPKGAQGGIAARLGVDLRTVEQMIAVLVAGRVIKVWQPPAYDRTTGVTLPRELRGETYAYNMFSLVGGVPAALAGHVRRFEGIDKQRAAEESPAAAEPSSEAYDFAGAAEDAATDVRALLERLRAEGADPPS